MALHWGPREFWAASLTEFTAAAKAYAQANRKSAAGGGRSVPPMTRERLDELRKLYPDT